MIRQITMIIALVLLQSCAGVLDGRPTRAEIDQIESSLVMPEGALPLRSYSRFYAATSSGIVGEFVAGDPHWFIEHRTVLETVSPSVFIVDRDNMPDVMDGGCGVLTLSYDRETHRVTGPACNGVA